MLAWQSGIPWQVSLWYASLLRTSYLCFLLALDLERYQLEKKVNCYAQKTSHRAGDDGKETEWYQLKPTDRYRPERLNLLISSFLCWQRMVWEPLKLFFAVFQCFSELRDSFQWRHTSENHNGSQLGKRRQDYTRTITSQKIILDSLFTCLHIFISVWTMSDLIDGKGHVFEAHTNIHCLRKINLVSVPAADYFTKLLKCA